jgi:AraC-like DNA-binding protein
MLFQEHQPPLCLKPYVRYYWTLKLKSPPVSHASQRLLAESFEFIFNLAAPIEFINCDGQIKRISTTGITGPMSLPMRMSSTGPLNLFGICFQPGGGYPFFKYPAHELVNQYPDVDDLWGPKGREFVASIQNDCQTTKSCIEAVNAYLINRLESNLRDDSVAQEAIETIEKYKGLITVEQLSHHLGLSRRHLTRKFKERIGMTPKQLCRNIRFKQVYKLIETASYNSWADVAVTCGYYDQSHLINEFKYFTGSSPDAYFFSSLHGPDFFTANF